MNSMVVHAVEAVFYFRAQVSCHP